MSKRFLYSMNISGSAPGGRITAASFGAVDVADLNATGAPGATTFLRGDGTWSVPAGSGGTVTSVNLTAPAAGITVSGGPITTSGSITLALANDLAALEGLTGTNTIYYRSAADTWTAVIIGSGLSFAGGTLSATGGGGTVTSVATGTGLTGGPITTTGTISLDVNGLTLATPAAADTVAGYSAAAAAVRKFEVDHLLGLQPGTPGGRLTLTSGSPVTAADVTGAASIYYTPYANDRVTLWDGTRWKSYTFTEQTAAFTFLTAIGAYDLFMYDAGTPTTQSVRGTPTRSTTGGATTNVTLPTLSANDLIVIFTSAAGGAVSCAGYTEVARQADSGSLSTLQCFVKAATGTETTATLSAIASYNAYAIANGGVVEAFGKNTTLTNTSLTSGGTGRVLLTAYGGGQAGLTGPAGQTCTAASGNNDPEYLVTGYESINAAGATTARTATGATTALASLTVLIKAGAGGPTLEIGPVWTNGTTRSTGISLQDGRYCKTGDKTRLYLGTFYSATGTTTEDSSSKRYVWNLYHRVVKHLKVVEATSTWTYTLATFRAANNSAANAVTLVRGLDEDAIDASVHAMASNSGAGATAVAAGVGIDSTTVNSAQVFGAQVTSAANSPVPAHYVGYPGIGYHTISWLEKSTAAGTTTWVGTAGGAFLQAGMTVTGRF